jgi:hypothetical protein
VDVNQFLEDIAQSKTFEKTRVRKSGLKRIRYYYQSFVKAMTGQIPITTLLSPPA